MNENSLIPYHTSELPLGPWLVFAPHPDDETFGMGGSILLAAKAGIEVDVVFMTDGSQGNTGGDDNIVNLRETEAMHACAALKVRECVFWRQSDRQLHASNQLNQQVTQQIKQGQYKHVFVPSCLEYHPDHRMTAKIVWDCLQQMTDMSVNIVSYDITNLGPCNLLIDISSVWGEKQQVMECYASQVAEHRYIELVQSVNTARTFSLYQQSSAAESFYVMSRLPGMSYAQVMQSWFLRFMGTSEIDHSLVSVIIRTKDRPIMLAQALSSLALQHYTNLEVIVVNDGGKSPLRVTASYEQQFTHLRLIENKQSKGRAAAANQGMQLVSGDYFMFLDDDDWFDSNHIAKLVQVLQNNSQALVAYTGARAVDSENIAATPVRVFDRPFDRNRLFYENYIPIHVVLMRRAILEHGCKMDESMVVLEDWDFWLQVCQLTHAFEHVPGVSANYRVGEDHGIGIKGGYDKERRQLYARWSKTWNIDELDDLLTRIVVLEQGS